VKKNDPCTILHCLVYDVIIKNCVGVSLGIFSFFGKESLVMRMVYTSLLNKKTCHWNKVTYNNLKMISLIYHFQ
jgi:hypothetical protein